MDSRDESPQRMRLKRLRRPWVIVAGLAAALAVAVPLAWAAFGDVPPSNPFYADINAIQGAGITQGCGGGNFCPNDFISRQAEAAFVHRAAGRTASDNAGIVSVPGSGTVDLAVISITVGGVAGQTQFVKVDGTGTTYINSVTGCPCQTRILISRDGAGTSEFTYTNNTFVGTSGFGLSNASPTAVFAVPSGSTQTFRLRASNWDGTGTVSAFGQITGVTVPFGHTGGSTLGATTLAGGNSTGVSVVGKK
jgi:S-layer homology domain